MSELNKKVVCLMCEGNLTRSKEWIYTEDTKESVASYHELMIDSEYEYDWKKTKKSQFICDSCGFLHTFVR